MNPERRHIVTVTIIDTPLATATFVELLERHLDDDAVCQIPADIHNPLCTTVAVAMLRACAGNEYDRALICGDVKAQIDSMKTTRVQLQMLWYNVRCKHCNLPLFECVRAVAV